MNKPMIVAALIAVSSLAGCLGCSAFNGGSDRVLSRNSDSIVLCENSGFIATTSAGTLEGTFITNPDGSMTGTAGPTGSTAFVLTWEPDRTVTTTDLGDGAWTELELNATELDHADVQCEDLVSRSWWSAQ
jgi:hypothetical protein